MLKKDQDTALLKAMAFSDLHLNLFSCVCPVSINSEEATDLLVASSL